MRSSAGCRYSAGYNAGCVHSAGCLCSAGTIEGPPLEARNAKKKRQKTRPLQFPVDGQSAADGEASPPPSPAKYTKHGKYRIRYYSTISLATYSFIHGSSSVTCRTCNSSTYPPVPPTPLTPPFWLFFFHLSSPSTTKNVCERKKRPNLNNQISGII